MSPTIKTIAEKEIILSKNPIGTILDVQFTTSLLQYGGIPAVELPTIELKATVKELNTPIKNATVHAKVILPNNKSTNVPFQQIKTGHFRAEYKPPIVGIYTFHIHAKGKTLADNLFNHEQTLKTTVSSGDYT